MNNIERIREKTITTFLERKVRTYSGGFFGIEEWAKFYGIDYSRWVPPFPWEENILEEPCPFYEGKKIKETHFIFLGLNTFKGEPLTILKWQRLHPKRFFNLPPNRWYNESTEFCQVPCGLRWYLALKGMVPNSTYKNFDEQKAMLPHHTYEVPLAIEVITMMMLHLHMELPYERWKENFLFRRYYVRTRSRCYIGCFDPDKGLGIETRTSYIYRDEDIGIAAFRRLP